MKNFKTTAVAAFAFIFLSTGTAFGQQDDAPLTKEEASITIDSIAIKLQASYVFPKVADEMAAKLKSNLKKGVYKSIDDPKEFAERLTADLQEISHDKHLRVRFDPARIREEFAEMSPEDSIKFLNASIARRQHKNFGFNEVKILEGNIGYLDLRAFSDPEYAGETAVAAMNFLSNTKAIIIDLRYNGGGSPGMIQLIASYLFTAEPVHLNNFYWRPTDENTQTWTLPHVPGKRNPDAAVYILTSKRTFSAAEEFSYDLKNLKRATIIGETTGGGAHPVAAEVATARFAVWVPCGRAISPITKTNWEGIGVIPHIAVPADEALKVAKMKALENLTETTQDAEQKQLYTWYSNGLKAELNPTVVDQKTLKSYAGTYNERVVTYVDGKLFYQRGEGTKYELIPMNQNEFMLSGMSDFRVKILSEGGAVTALQGMYEGGMTDKDEKTK